MALLLEGTTDNARLDETILALGKGIGEKKCYDQAGALVDLLSGRSNLRSNLIAGSILIRIIGGIPFNAFALPKEIETYPDALCDRAAALLDHPNPVVQAGGEWALALRVKRQDSSTRNLKQQFLKGFDNQAWYRKWKARDRKLDLRDDYARQLIQFAREYNVAGVGEAIERTASRMTALSRDAGSRDAEKQVAAYKDALTKARAAAAGADLANAHFAYLALRAAARELIANSRPDFPAEGFVFFTNPTTTGGVWNVNVPVTNNTNPPGGDLFVKRGADPALAAESLLGNKLGDGSIRGIDLTWESDKVLFSFWHQPINGTPPFGWDTLKNANLYEMSLPAGTIKELTNAPGYNDIEPCFLPDGGYVFASDRSSFGNQCAGPILQNKRCTTLFRLDPKRAAVPVAISNNKDFDRHPHVLNDGNVVFMHWEYQERGLYSSHNVWRCRPDGTNMDAYYKQHISAPFSIRDARQAPDSDLHVATAQGHHAPQIGPIILFNPAMGINNDKAMWLLTPGVADIEGGLGPLAKQIVPEGGIENAGGHYINPFPMSEKAFLAGHDMTGDQSEFAIYYLDVWGNKELLHKDRDMSCFMPIALRSRKRPPVVADMIDPKATFATAFVEDVYRDLPNVEKGTVKYLRLSQSLMLPAPVFQKGSEWAYNHLHFLPGDATARHFGYWLWSPSRVVGIVKVEDDGSAYFKVPAGTPVYLQALDANFCEIRRMRTSFTLQRGEFRSCTGCHESRLQTVANRKAYPSATLAKGPQMPVAPSWGDTTILDYRKHIQPIFNAYCVSCHGAKQPAGGIELTGREIGGFAQSYRSLFGLKPEDPTPVKELDWHLVLDPGAKDAAYTSKKEADDALIKMQKNEWPGQLVSISDRQGDSSITQPMQFGSNKSKLIRVLLDEPKDHKPLRSKMTPDEWLVLVTWVDFNATYQSTLFDVSHYEKTKTFTRVPYDLPSPWEPSDLSPAFHNTAENPKVGSAR